MQIFYDDQERGFAGFSAQAICQQGLQGSFAIPGFQHARKIIVR